MPRIILTTPFLRHYAGSVFELELDPTPDGWDEDTRVREKMSYHRRSYLLPDDGRGRTARLSVSDTLPCPDGVFEAPDLRTGPCRFTAMHPGPEGAPNWTVPEPELAQAGQALALRLAEPLDAALYETTGGQLLRRFRAPSGPLTLDFSDLMPGFYRLALRDTEGKRIDLHFLKCFPLVAVFEPGTRRIREWMQTVY